MPFRMIDVNSLLAQCHRRCCICHRFCGVKIELHHIEPTVDGGGDDIDNAIPVCFECHAEIQLYNDRHPRGRKFRPEELRLHRDQWLRLCNETPSPLLPLRHADDVGPLQAMIDELEFNLVLAGRRDAQTIGAFFLVAQFERAIAEGLFALLGEVLRRRLANVYATMMKANVHLQTLAELPVYGPTSTSSQHAMKAAQSAIESVEPDLRGVRDALLAQLGHAQSESSPG